MHCLSNTTAVGRTMLNSTCTGSTLAAVYADVKVKFHLLTLPGAEWLVTVLAKHDVNGGHRDSHLHGDKLRSCDHGCT